jgi:Protein of unknown function (DUF3047)
MPMFKFPCLLRVFAPVVTAMALLQGCASVPEPAAEASMGFAHSPWTQSSGLWSRSSRQTVLGNIGSEWTHYRLPGKAATEFKFEPTRGRTVMAVHAVSSASMLRRRMQVAPEALRGVRFSWKTETLIPLADMSDRDKDDSPVRVVLAFDGDRSTFSAKNSILNELTRLITGEEMPYAVMMYVWSKEKPVGTVIHSPRTDRVRKLVVQSGEDKLAHWVDYERDVLADFRQVYGEAPGNLVGMGIMTDTDNTRTTARAWYGPVHVLVD